MRDFYKRSLRRMDRIMAANGVSFARARLLMFIAKEGRCRSIDLASFLDVTPRTVTEAIDGLERDGLVRREADPDDRRAKWILLTETGHDTVSLAETSRLAYIEQVFGVLEESEREELVRLLAKLNDRLSALPE